MSNEQVFSFLVDPKDVSWPIHYGCKILADMAIQADGNRPGDPEYDPRTLYIPSAAWKSFTPFETQFWEIKQNHYDTVLFFQKGKFFELVHSVFTRSLTEPR